MTTPDKRCLFALLIALCFQSCCFGLTANNQSETGKDYSLELKLLEEKQYMPRDEIYVEVILTNKTNEKKTVQPFVYGWLVNGQECVMAYSTKSITHRNFVWIIEPHQAISKIFNISQLNKPMLAFGGYDILRVPGKFVVRSIIRLSEWKTVYSPQDIDLKSDDIEIERIDKPETTQFYNKLLKIIDPGWKLIYITDRPEHINQGYSISCINEKIRPVEKHYLSPDCALFNLYFIPKSKKLDLPNYMNGFNSEYVDYLYLGSSSEYDVFGNIINAEHSVLKEIGSNIIKGLD